MKKIIIICLIILISLIGVAYFLCFDSNDYYPIEFPTYPEPTVFDNTELVYNIETLESQIISEDYYVYTNPKLTDYSIVEKFGFDINNYRLTDDGEERIYEAEGRDEKKTLWIDKFGCFSYSTGISTPYMNMPFTAEECNKIAKDFLKKYGLYSDRIGTRRSVNESWDYPNPSLGVDEKHGTLLTIDINFIPEDTDGRGTGKVLVEVNANGEIVHVLYNLREYDSMQQTDLISLKKAMERFEKGNAFIEVENPSKKLIFENAKLSYYSQESDKENLLMQPVYVFTGTSETFEGEKESFAITVQAN